MVNCKLVCVWVDRIVKMPNSSVLYVVDYVKHAFAFPHAKYGWELTLLDSLNA